MPSLTPLMHSILDRLLQLLPDEPRVAKQLNDILDSDARLGRELSDRAALAAPLEDTEATAAHAVPASGLQPAPAAARRAS